MHLWRSSLNWAICTVIGAHKDKLYKKKSEESKSTLFAKLQQRQLNLFYNILRVLHAYFTRNL